MRPEQRPFLALEPLEDRLTPSFTGMYNPATDTWTLTQVSNEGPVAIAVAAGTNELIVDETFGVGGMATFGVATGSLTINLLDNSDDLAIINDGGLSGNLTVNLKSGFRGAFLSGDGTVGGQLTFTGGADSQLVDLGFNPIFFSTTPVSVGGSVNIDLGTGFDIVLQDDDLTVGGSFTMRGVNDFLDFPDDGSLSLVVGGDLNFYANQENLESELNIDDLALLSIGGNVTYLGGSSEDNFDADGNTLAFIGGNVYINLGNHMDVFADDQDVELAGVVIGGNLTILAGTNVAGVIDEIETDADTVIGGNIYINTGAVGDGDFVELLGTVGGNSVTVLTGLGADTVQYGMTGSRPRVYVSLGLGDDSFTLGDGVTNPSLGYLYVDFGAGSDTFTNNFMGAFTFPVLLRNLP